MNDIEDIKSDGQTMRKAHLASSALSIVLVVAMAVMVRTFAMSGLFQGLLLGACLYFRCNFITLAKQYYWESRPKPLVLISGGYEFTSFLIAGGVLSVWT